MAAILALARLLASVMHRRISANHSLSSGVAHRAEPILDCRQQLRLKSCQFAQRRDLIDAAKVARSILRGRQQNPRSEKRQLIEGALALPGEGARPPLCLALGASPSRLPATSAADAASRSRQSRAAASVVGRESHADARSF